MALTREEIIGNGWSFPLRMSATGGIGMSGQERKLDESIRLILSTAMGERPMRPEFGCAIHEYVFAPADGETRVAIAAAVRSALRRWEPRIEVGDVDVSPDQDEPALLWVDVRYKPVETNSPRNLVFPFYTIPAEE